MSVTLISLFSLNVKAPEGKIKAGYVPDAPPPQKRKKRAAAEHCILPEGKISDSSYEPSVRDDDGYIL